MNRRGPVVEVDPNNEEAEVSALGAILLSSECLPRIIEQGLRSRHFYRKRNGLIFDAIVALHEIAEPIDTLLVCAELKRRGTLKDAGGEAYVTSLPNLVPAAGNVRAYVALVIEAAHLRAILDATRRAQAAIFANDRPQLATALNRLSVLGLPEAWAHGRNSKVTPLRRSG